MEKLLILNPGSTSTKIAVFEDETPLFTESITHTPEELAAFDCVADQYEFRRDLVIATLKKHGVALESLTGIVSRGGLLPPSRRAPTRSTTTWYGSSKTSPKTSMPPT